MAKTRGDVVFGAPANTQGIPVLFLEPPKTSTISEETTKNPTTFTIQGTNTYTYINGYKDETTKTQLKDNLTLTYYLQKIDTTNPTNIINPISFTIGFSTPDLTQDDILSNTEITSNTNYFSSTPSRNGTTTYSFIQGTYKFYYSFKNKNDLNSQEIFSPNIYITFSNS